MSRDNIRVVEFDAALDFIDALSPSSGVFADGYRPYPMVYRGHGRADVALIPSAFRKQAWDGCLCHFHLKGIPLPEWGMRSFETQIWCEFHALYAFFEMADRQGLRLPDDSQTLRHELQQWLSYLKDLCVQGSADDGRLVFWPPRIVLSVMALAQHFGLPTRLLDWSWSPYVAAYMAARSALSSQERPSQLCVWALSTSAFEVAELIQESRGLELVTAPTAENSNLRAQQGLFLLHRPPSFRAKDTFQCEALEEATREGVHSFVKLILPATEAAELLRLLACLGVHGASMFPGFEGVLKSMAESYGLWPIEADWHKSDQKRQVLEREKAIRTQLYPPRRQKG